MLRVRLEGERIQIAAHLAAIDATRARMDLLREMGQAAPIDIVLTEPLDAGLQQRGRHRGGAVDQQLHRVHPCTVDRRVLEHEVEHRRREAGVTGRLRLRP